MPHESSGLSITTDLPSPSLSHWAKYKGVHKQWNRKRSKEAHYGEQNNTTTVESHVTISKEVCGLSWWTLTGHSVLALKIFQATLSLSLSQEALLYNAFIMLLEPSQFMSVLLQSRSSLAINLQWCINHHQLWHNLLLIVSFQSALGSLEGIVDIWCMQHTAAKIVHSSSY